MKKLIATLLLAAVPACSLAGTITYDFTVDGGSSGALAGVTSTGYFSFDDSIIPTGGGIVIAANLLTDLSFNWIGVLWDETSANTGALSFDADGKLTQWLFGNDCSAGSCGVHSDDPGWFMFGVSEYQRFAYSVGDGIYDGTYVVTLRAPETATVAEPSALGLLAAAGFGLALTWRRQRTVKRQELPLSAAQPA